MEHRHGFKMPPKDQSVIYHHHFHHIIYQNQGRERVHKRLGSDDNLRTIKVTHQNNDKQSTSSHQSWKRFINPAFQAQESHKIKSFKSTLPTEKTHLSFQGDKLKLSQLTSRENRQYMTPKPITDREKVITNTTIRTRQQEIQESREDLFRSLSDHYPQYLQKSSFSKKISFGPHQSEQQGQTFKGQSTKISAKDKSGVFPQQKEKERESYYGYTLLKEQTKYLRSTFLKHYIKNHILKEQMESN